MTENTYQPIPAEPAPWNPPTVPPKKKWFAKPLVWLPVAALVLGAGLGSAGQKTVTVPGPERTVTKEVKVPTTPAACSEAFSLAEQVFTASASTVGVLSDALTAAGRFDVAALQGMPAKIQAQTDLINGINPKYKAAKSSCLQ
ncbi:MAG TPA: hypothetical protein DEP82_14835 [Arthrobacter bacterium]|nr:hypothetical protein [Arthrobacter sp.]